MSFDTLTALTRAATPFAMASNASMISSPCSLSLSSNSTHGACSCQGGTTTSTFVFFFLGNSVAPSPKVPALLPEAFFSSALFCFGAGANPAHSFANSDRKHFCFLPAHAAHTAPASVYVTFTLRATSSFHFSTTAKSTWQQESVFMHIEHCCHAHSLNSQKIESDSPNYIHKQIFYA